MKKYIEHNILATRIFLMVTLLIPWLVLSKSVTANAIVNDFGISSPNYEITFNELIFPMGTVIDTQYSFIGVTFDTVTLPSYSGSNFRYDVQGLGATFRGIDSHYIGSTGGNPLYINFLSTQTEVAFGLASNPREIEFSALLNGQIVESFTISTSGGSFPEVDGVQAGYFGFSDVAFNSVEIRGVLNTQTDNRVLLDNIQFQSIASVPEPNSIVLYIFGILAIYGVQASRAPNKRADSVRGGLL